MTVRNFRPEDLPALKRIAETSGFPYPDGKRLEAFKVFVDDAGEPVMAVAAERTVQLYFWCGDGMKNPHARIFALRLLHEEMARELALLGYPEADAFLPPSIAERFGRRLEKTFGWVKNWPSWTHRTGA